MSKVNIGSSAENCDILLGQRGGSPGHCHCSLEPSVQAGRSSDTGQIEGATVVSLEIFVQACISY